MNISLFSHRPSGYQVVLALAAGILYGLIAWQWACADAAPPPDPTVGGAGPYRPQKTNVQMLSETVVITVPPYMNEESNQITVRASFLMQNQGQNAEEMQVIFPLTHLHRLEEEGSDYGVDAASFVALVNGQPVTTTEISTPAEKGYQLEFPDHSAAPESGFSPDVRWAAFEVSFPVGQKVSLEVDYKMDGISEFGGISYILETGAGWYGNILSADLTLRLPYAATSKSVPKANPGYIFSGNEIHWKLTNFKPTERDNLVVKIIPPQEWQAVLELRSRVERYPQDADAWYQLGNQYVSVGSWYPFEDTIIRYPHLINLAIAAYRKAIALRPDWGDAHYKLAVELWFNNPNVPRGFVMEYPKESSEFPAFRDPAIQPVFAELKLAASDGATDPGFAQFIKDLSRFYPNLQLVVPQTPTPAWMQPPVLSITAPVVALAAGIDHTCFLTQDSQVGCAYIDPDHLWEPALDTVSRNATAVVAGDGFTCTLTSARTVQCQGLNAFGQLGDGTTKYREQVVDVTGLGDVVALAAGDSHTCGLLGSGAVVCWGRNYFGQLGDGTTAYSSIPVQVNGLSSGATSIATGNNFSSAILTDHTVRCWGADSAGQLGDGGSTNQSIPVSAAELPNNVTTLTAGFAHTCALTSQGEVLCWGDNSEGQLGDGSNVSHRQPLPVIGLDRGIKEVVAGDQFTCALTALGGVKCWGNNQYGQLGDGSSTTHFTPVDVVGLSSGAISLAAGRTYACVLMQTGQVKCWGVRADGDARYGEISMGSRLEHAYFTYEPVEAIPPAIQPTATAAFTPTNTPYSTNTPPSFANGTSTKSVATGEIVGMILGFTVVVAVLYIALLRRKRPPD